MNMGVIPSNSLSWKDAKEVRELRMDEVAATVALAQAGGGGVTEYIRR